MNFFAKLNRPSIVYTNIILLFFLLNGVLAKSNLQLDISRDQRNSLSESTTKVLARLDSPVLVEAYISRDLPGQLMAYIDPYLSTLRSIDNEGGDLVELQIINPVLPEEIQKASERGIQGVSLTEAREVEVTSRQFFFGIYMQYGETSRVIQLVDPEGRIVPNLEYEFLREVRAMLRKDKSSGIAFVSSEGSMNTMQPQRGQQSYDKESMWGFKTLLERDAGQIEEVNLAEPVKAGLDTLVLSGLPKLSDLEQYNLDQFLMRGGNLIFLTRGYDFTIQQGGQNPYMQQMGGGKSMGFAMVPQQDVDSINQWLGKYGIVINAGMLIDPGQGVIQINDPLRRTPFPQPYPAWAYYSRDNNNIIGQHKLIEYTNELVLPWPSGLDVREVAQQAGQVEYKTLIQSNTNAISVDSQSMDFRAMIELVKDPTRDRVGRAIPLAVLASGKFKSAFDADSIPGAMDLAQFNAAQVGDSRSNILVIGSSYLVSDILLTGQVNFELFGINRSFFQNALEALQGDDELLDVRSRVPALAILEIKDPLWQLLFMIIHIFTLPALLAIYGTLRLYRRNRKQGIQTQQEAN